MFACVVVCQQPRKLCDTQVLFTGTTNSLFSTPRISITTGPISIKFTYFMPSIHTTIHTKLKKIGPVVHEIRVS